MRSKPKHMGLTHWKTPGQDTDQSSKRVYSGNLLTVRLDPLPIHSRIPKGDAQTHSARNADAEWNQRSSTVKGSPSLPLQDQHLRFNVTQRCRMKEFGNYNAETVLKNLKLPLIFRKPVYDGLPSNENENKTKKASKQLFLPPITQGGNDGLVFHRPMWRGSLDKAEKVASIPSVQRRLEKKHHRNRPNLEAKGTKAPTRTKTSNNAAVKKNEITKFV